VPTGRQMPTHRHDFGTAWATSRPHFARYRKVRAANFVLFVLIRRAEAGLLLPDLWNDARLATLT
jgi:hypothetical protein